MPIAPESIGDAYTAGRRVRRGWRRQGAQAPRQWRFGLTPGSLRAAPEGRPCPPQCRPGRTHAPGRVRRRPRAHRPRVACGPETAGERPVPASVKPP